MLLHTTRVFFLPSILFVANERRLARQQKAATPVPKTKFNSEGGERSVPRRSLAERDRGEKGGAAAPLRAPYCKSPSFWVSGLGAGERDLAKRLTPSIFVAEIGEPPDVGQVHSEADDGEKEVDLLAPRLPVLGAVAGRGGGGQEVAAGVLHAVVLLHQDQLHVLPRGRRPRALRQRGHHRHFAVGLDLFVHPRLKHPERASLRRGSGWGGAGKGRREARCPLQAAPLSSPPVSARQERGTAVIRAMQMRREKGGPGCPQGAGLPAPFLRGGAAGSRRTWGRPALPGPSGTERSPPRAAQRGYRGSHSGPALPCPARASTAGRSEVGWRQVELNRTAHWLRCGTEAALPACLG